MCVFLQPYLFIHCHCFCFCFDNRRRHHRKEPTENIRGVRGSRVSLLSPLQPGICNEVQVCLFSSLRREVGSVPLVACIRRLLATSCRSNYYFFYIILFFFSSLDVVQEHLRLNGSFFLSTWVRPEGGRCEQSPNSKRNSQKYLVTV